MNAFKRRLRRIIYQTEEKRFHPLTWVFVFMTLVWGVMFVFFPGSVAVQGTMIFQLTAEYIPAWSWLPNLFGFANLLTVLGTVFALMFRELKLAPYFSMLGFVTWVFATALYTVEGLLIATLTVAGPLMFFWGFFFVTIQWYRNSLDQGLAKPPE